MNKIEKLIDELCFDGVEFKELWEIGSLYGGLKGKSKDDFTDGNAKFITYMNIFSNILVDTNIKHFVKIQEGENQTEVQYGDVLFTGSSETPNECGMSSVLTEETNDPIYLNSFSFGFRLFDKKLFLPDFLKYLFRDISMRKKISKTASGVTRFNISKKRFIKLEIPIPPIKIQEEIVKILDNFTQLEAELEVELEVELEARKQQYEYYRDEMLSFGEEVEFKELGEVLKKNKGTKITATKMKKLHKDNAPIKIFAGGETFALVEFEDIPKNDIYNIPSIIVKSRGIVEFEYYNNFFSHKNEFWSYFSENREINIKYVFYYLKTKELYFQRIASKMQMPQISQKDTEKFKIPIPSLEKQEEIVDILDKFDKLVNDISEGLPAEIKARKQQYEYYREKLLDFKEMKK